MSVTLNWVKAHTSRDSDGEFCDIFGEFVIPDSCVMNNVFRDKKLRVRCYYQKMELMRPEVWCIKEKDFSLRNTLILPDNGDSCMQRLHDYIVMGRPSWCTAEEARRIPGYLQAIRADLTYRDICSKNTVKMFAGDKDYAASLIEDNLFIHYSYINSSLRMDFPLISDTGYVTSWFACVLNSYYDCVKLEHKELTSCSRNKLASFDEVASKPMFMQYMVDNFKFMYDIDLSSQFGIYTKSMRDTGFIDLSSMGLW